MKFPCENCITLPICLSNFSRSYKHLEIDYGPSTMLLFYSVINLKDKATKIPVVAELLQEPFIWTAHSKRILVS